MKSKIVLIITLFIISISGLASAQEYKDVEIEILLPGTINESQEYKEIFLLRNINDTPGVDDDLDVEVNYTIQENNYSKNFSFLKNINYYSKSGMGKINLTNGTYSLCVNITAINYLDTNYNNNYDCKNISVIGEKIVLEFNDSINETNTTNNESIEEEINDSSNKTKDICNYNLKIYTKKQIYNKGEKIEFKIYLNNDSNKSYPFEISYWVEDLFENIVKKEVITKSKSEKRYTPKFSEEEKAYLIKAKTGTCSLDAEKLVVFKGESEVEERETNLEIEFQNGVFKEPFFVTIDGYKGNTGKTLISLWIESDEKKVSEVTKTYITDKFSEFKQKLPIIFKDVYPEEDNFVLIIDGLGIREEFDVSLELIEIEEEQEIECEIQECVCDEIKEIDKKQIKVETPVFSANNKDNISNQSNSITASVIQTSPPKIKNSYVFFTVVALVSTFFLFKKDLKSIITKKTKLFK